MDRRPGGSHTTPGVWCTAGSSGVGGLGPRYGPSPMHPQSTRNPMGRTGCRRRRSVGAGGALLLVHRRQRVEPNEEVEGLLPCLLGLLGEARQLVDAPVLEEHGHDHLVVVDAEVVDAVLGHLDRLRLELGDLEAGHREADHLPLDRHHHGRGVDLEGGLRELAVEDVVEVLVDGDPRRELLDQRILRVRAGVAVRDPGRELLQARVHQAVERVRERPAVVRVVAAAHGLHPAALERDGIHAAGDREVVAQHDGVPALLGRPPARPLAPRAVLAERVPQREVVVGEVVLRQQVDLERGARDGAEIAVGLLPRLLDVVAPDLVGDELVREPLRRPRQVRLEASPNRGLELLQEVLRRELRMTVPGSTVLGKDH